MIASSHNFVRRSFAVTDGVVGLRRDRIQLAKRGFTLIELLLVIAIIVVVAALSVPAIQRTIKAQGVRSGADRVRVAMGQARVKSIRAGEVYALFYARNGSWFNIAPLSQYRDIVSQQQSRERQRETVANRDLEYDLLPQGVTFVAGEAGEDSRSAASKEDVGNSVGQLEMILFYPDGSSQDAAVTIQNEMGDMWRVELRGLTGSSTASMFDPSQRGG